MNRNSLTYVLFIGVIVGSILTYTQLPSYRYVVPVLALGSFAIYVIVYQDVEIQAPRYLLVCLLLIWSVYLVHAFRSPGVIELSGRVPLFIVVSIICIFLIPRAVPKYVFLDTMSTLATVVVIVGLPAVLLNGYTIGPLEVITWHGTNDLLPITIPVLDTLPKMRSVFHNPNPFSEFVFVGLVASLYKFDYDRSYYSFAMVGITGFGLYLGSSRATVLAATLATTTYLLYRLTGQDYLNGIVVAISVAIGTLLLMFLRIVPSPELITNMDLTGRLSLWQGSFRAFSERPLLGFGPGDTGSYIEPFVRSGYAGNNPHNSYIRLFVTTGLIGGISYLFMIFETLKNHSIIVDTRESAAILSILVGFAVNQLFLGFSLFGISSSSVLAATTLGYSAAVAIGE